MVLASFAAVFAPAGAAKAAEPTTPPTMTSSATTSITRLQFIDYLLVLTHVLTLPFTRKTHATRRCKS
jgi:hypothetical protein